MNATDREKMPLIEQRHWRERWFPNGEWVLLAALAV
jgi:hypothetical protein